MSLNFYSVFIFKVTHRVKQINRETVEIKRMLVALISRLNAGRL